MEETTPHPLVLARLAGGVTMGQLVSGIQAAARQRVTENPETPAFQELTVPLNHHDDPSTCEDDFDYSQHVPIELPVGPWDCLDRACEQYEAPDGSDLPDVTYCSHVTVLVLCSACSGASANHAIKNEIAWDDCEERRHKQTNA